VLRGRAVASVEVDRALPGAASEMEKAGMNPGLFFCPREIDGKNHFSFRIFSRN
jgi:hypothetical protein